MFNTFSLLSSLSIYTLVDLLRYRANKSPDKMAYTFLRDGEIEESSYTFAELDLQAQAIAARLQKTVKPGSRALLLYPNGVEYIAAYFGCLYAGVVAVPAYPPRRNRSDHRLGVIAADAGASTVLTTTDTLQRVEQKQQLKFAEELSELEWIASDAIEPGLAEQWQPPLINGETLAFLQYTSGSTGKPKGVMVSHANLLHNLDEMEKTFHFAEDGVMVTWLPIFHDMGLIYGILGPFYVGCSCYLMMPGAFLQKPLRWLKAISNFSGTHTAAPNFAYELCVDRATADQLENLDLSSLYTAMNGAEAVRHNTLDHFAEMFKPYGFNPVAACPGYGLAEATLDVAATNSPDVAPYIDIEADALSQDKVLVVDKADQQPEKRYLTQVGCGNSETDTRIVIVEPENFAKCAADEVGEIWVAGNTIAQGYWQNEKATQEIFQAKTSDGDGPFMRTGDMGFLYENNLYITGRLKDIIVIRGANYYPNDIELVVECSHPSLNPSGAAAFSVDVEGEERLVILQEIRRTELKKLDVDAVMEAIRAAIAEQHELQTYAIVLIHPATLPKTSSGKVQRSICRQSFLEHTIAKEVARWQQSGTEKNTQLANKPESILQELLLVDEESRPAYLQSYLFAVLQRVNIRMEQGDEDKEFWAFGMDSLNQVEVALILSEDLDVDLPGTSLRDQPTISKLTAYLLANVPALNASIARDKDAAAHQLITLDAVPRDTDLPLSLVQSRYWYHQATSPNGCFHNVPWMLQIHGELDTECLQQSLDTLVQRHEILRTTFPVAADQPLQLIHDANDYRILIRYQDLRHTADKQAVIDHLLEDELQYSPFNLQHGPLMRVNLLQPEDKNYVLFICQHHIINDAQSLFILTRELWAIYRALRAAQPVSLPELPIQYADYAVWQRKILESNGLGTRYAYWQKWLEAGEPQPLELSIARQRKKSVYKTDSLSYALSTELSNQFSGYSRNHDVSPLVTGLSALALLLQHYSGSDDIIIGTTFSYRGNRKLEQLVGPLTSVLQIRFDLSGELTPATLIAQVQQNLQQAITHQDIPFQHIAGEHPMLAQQDPSIPFFNVMLTYLPDVFENWQDDTLQVAPVDMKNKLINRPDLVLWMSENKQSGTPVYDGFWRYREDLFERSDAENINEAFQQIIAMMVANPDTPLKTLTLQQREG